eukprot:1181470-Prorocentrum_minimum.AAC.3
MVSQRLGPEVISRDHVLRLRNGVLSPARLISGCPACHQGRLAEVAAPLIALMATSTAALQTGLQTGAAAEVERGAAGVRRAAAVVAAVVTALADTPRDARRCLHAALVAALVQNIMQVYLISCLMEGLRVPGVAQYR